MRFPVSQSLAWCADKPHWAVIMSRGSKYTKQVIEMDFQYPSEGIHYHWDQGECIALPGVAKLHLAPHSNMRLLNSRGSRPSYVTDPSRCDLLQL